MKLSVRNDQKAGVGVEFYLEEDGVRIHIMAITSENSEYSIGTLEEDDKGLVRLRIYGSLDQNFFATTDHDGGIAIKQS